MERPFTRDLVIEALKSLTASGRPGTRPAIELALDDPRLDLRSFFADEDAGLPAGPSADLRCAVPGLPAPLRVQLDRRAGWLRCELLRYDPVAAPVKHAISETGLAAGVLVGAGLGQKLGRGNPWASLLGALIGGVAGARLRHTERVWWTLHLDEEGDWDVEPIQPGATRRALPEYLPEGVS